MNTKPIFLKGLREIPLMTFKDVRFVRIENPVIYKVGDKYTFEGSQTTLSGLTTKVSNTLDPKFYFNIIKKN